MIYTVVSESCSDCDSIAVGVFDHKPTEKEITSVSDCIGGMYCINNHIFKLEINGEPQEELEE